MPSPDHYRNKHEIEAIKDKIVTPTLYKAERKTQISEVIKSAAKRTIGPGSFNPKRTEARVTGTYGGLERVTMAD